MIRTISRVANFLWRSDEYGGDADPEGTDSDDEFPADVFSEKKTFCGKVTTLNDDYGLVDGYIYFTPKVIIGGSILKIGDCVTGEACRERKRSGWIATNVCVAQDWDDESTNTLRTHEDVEDFLKEKINEDISDVALITSLNESVVTFNGDKSFRLVNVKCDVKYLTGDWVLCKYYGNEESNTWLLKEISPLRKCKIEGEVTSVRHDSGVINNEVYFNRAACSNGYVPRSGDHVHAEVIESCQNRFSWRATKIMPSSTSSHVINVLPKFKPSLQKSKFMDELMADKQGIKITDSPDFGVMFLEDDPKYLTIYIRNCSAKVHKSLKCKVQNANEVGDQFAIQSIRMMQNNKAVKISDSVALLLPNMAAFANVICSPKFIGHEKRLLLFEFEEFVIGRHVTVEVQAKSQSTLLATSRYTKERSRGLLMQPSDVSSHQNSFVVPGERPFRPKNFIPVRLPQFHIPHQLKELIGQKQDLLSVYPELQDDLCTENYKKRMSLLLHLEELKCQMEMREFDLYRICMRHFGEYLALAVPGLAEGRPSLLIGDRVLLTNPGEENGIVYEGYIHQVLSSEICLKFSTSFHSSYNGEDFNVRFEFNRTPLRRCHQCVDLASSILGERVLFPSKVEPKVPQVRLLDGTETSRSRIPKTATKFFIKPFSGSKMFNNTDSVVRSQTVLNRYNSRTKMSCIAESPSSTQLPHTIIESETLKQISNCVDETSNSKASNSSSPWIVPNVYKSGVRKLKPSDKYVQSIDKTLKVKNPLDVYGMFERHVARVPSKQIDERIIEWSNKLLNDRQKSAVRRISCGLLRPIPYVIFGPPGTGKTITVVEAILQTLKLIPSSRILAATPSNSAADLIAERLHLTGLVNTEDMVRLNAFQRNLDTLPECVIKYCSVGTDIEISARKRVVICTCVTAGTLYSLGLKEGHFTHIFVDEAGQATEPECLIPLGLAAGQDCQIVLAGDPQQLGPVLRSVPAKLYGLQTSFIERLMNRRLYARDSDKFADHGNYDPLLVTKLVCNYRSHEAILKYPSKTFYDDELIPCVPSDTIKSFCDWPALGKPDFPLLFHGVVGDDMREGDSPSWFNPAEVVQVVSYLRELTDDRVKPEDVGIITPYRKQVEKIRMMMVTMDLLGSKVGSVEEFQGQERPVIILSTVRSSSDALSVDYKHTLGFISNPKRFNVAITRAQALLIVVGNPYVLSKDKYWRSFIEYCVENKSYVGCLLDYDDQLPTDAPRCFLRSF